MAVTLDTPAPSQQPSSIYGASPLRWAELPTIDPGVAAASAPMPQTHFGPPSATSPPASISSSDSQQPGQPTGASFQVYELQPSQNNPSSNAGQALFRHLCSYCGRGFNRKIGLESHMALHTGLRQYGCSKCPQRFSRKHDAQRHKKSHETKREFMCVFCESTFKRKDALDRHLRSTTNLIHRSETSNFVFVVEYDTFLVFVSYWTAVTGAYTGIQVVNQLLRIYRKYIAINVAQLLSVLPRVKGRLAKRAYALFHINPKIILSLFLVAIAFGGCGVWSMHFVGMHALQVYALPRSSGSNNGAAAMPAVIVNGTASAASAASLPPPFYNPFSERIERSLVVVIPIYYEVGLTILSLLAAVGVVFVGVFVAAFGVGMVHTRIDPKDLFEIVKRFHGGTAVPVVERSGHASLSGSGGESVPRTPLQVVLGSGAGSSVFPAPAPVASPGAVSPSAAAAAGVSPHSAVFPGLPEREPRSFFEAPDHTLSTASTDTTDQGLGATINLEKSTFLRISAQRKSVFLLGCTITGLGVAAMHYFGIASMRIPGVRMTHSPHMVVLAIAVGILAATAGLWILFFLKGAVQRLVSPLIIGVAVVALHYTAMAGVTFEFVPDPVALDYDAFYAQNPTVVGGELIETLRSVTAYTIELVILVIGFKLLHVA